MLRSIWTHCPLCKSVVKYKPDPLETRESMSRELDIRIYEHQENLCSRCASDFGACKGNPKFGNCVGNDNVIEGDNYKDKEQA